MLFSQDMKEIIIEKFIEKNITNKLNNKEKEYGKKISKAFKISDLDVLSSMFLATYLITLLIINIMVIFFIGYNKDNNIYILLSTWTLLIPVFTPIMLSRVGLNNSKKKLKEKINKKTILGAFESSLEYILNNKNNKKVNKQLIVEAKEYILMLTENKEDYLYDKIVKEKLFSVNKKLDENILLEKYYITCSEFSKKKPQLISEEEMRNFKIEKSEQSGFNANLEINKILENI